MTHDPLRYARRLHDEAMLELHRAWAPLDSGDVPDYSERVRRATSLLSAARWAADAPHVGRQLMTEHGVELYEREAPTDPATPTAKADR